jgi:putative sporulation protein YtaF
LLREIFIAFIVSIDTYLAAAAYCNNGIRIPVLSAAVISTFGAAVLGISIKFSSELKDFVPPSVFHICGITILCLIGILMIGKSIIREIVKKMSRNDGISLKINKGSLVVRLYLDDTAADADNSKILSVSEAFTIAFASSMDSAVTGIGSGSSGINYLAASGMTFIFGCIALFMGNLTGKKISSLDHDLSWVGGVMLILFAFLC